MNKVKEISAKDLKAKLDRKESLTLIDVREPFERDIASIGGELIPLKTLPEHINSIPRTGEVIIYCRSGARSGRACEALQAQFGFENIWNLKGGILAWADDVDPTTKKY